MEQGDDLAELMVVDLYLEDAESEVNSFIQATLKQDKNSAQTHYLALKARREDTKKWYQELDMFNSPKHFKPVDDALKVLDSIMSLMPEDL